MTKPLITQVLWTLDRGGAERMVFDLSRLLPAAGFEVQVIAARGGGDMQAEFQAADIPVIVGPASQNRRQTVGFLRQQISRWRPDVWHTHLGGDVWGGLAAWTKRLRPWVITAHSQEQLPSRLATWLRRQAFCRADRVVCISETVKQAIIKRYRPPRDRLQVIRLGIDVNLYQGQPRNSFADVPRLIAVGRLTAEKNYATLLQGLALVKRPWRLDVVGDGPERAHLQQLAESLGLSPRIKWSGSLPAIDVAKRLAQSDVFCFPSLAEGQGLALLEAAAMGLPIVSSSLPAISEKFTSDELLPVEPRSPRAWADALLQTLGQPVAAHRRARRAQRIVQTEFTLERMVADYVELYRTLLAGKNL